MKLKKDNKDIISILSFAIKNIDEGINIEKNTEMIGSTIECASEEEYKTYLLFKKILSYKELDILTNTLLRYYSNKTVGL